jgi:transposase
MRGSDAMQESVFTVAKLDDFVPPDHPLRTVRVALLLQVFYSVRSERQLMEQMRYNLLFRWFVGLAIDDDLSILPAIWNRYGGSWPKSAACDC